MRGWRTTHCVTLHLLGAVEGADLHQGVEDKVLSLEDEADGLEEVLAGVAVCDGSLPEHLPAPGGAGLPHK